MKQLDLPGIDIPLIPHKDTPRVRITIAVKTIPIKNLRQGWSPWRKFAIEGYGVGEALKGFEESLKKEGLGAKIRVKRVFK